MQDELITIDDIYLQDIVCDIVFAYSNEDDVSLYNRIATIIDIDSMALTVKILDLIKMNKMLFNI